jgi:nitroreductase
MKIRKKQFFVKNCKQPNLFIILLISSFMDLIKAIQERRSVKKFKERAPNWRKIIECIDLMRYAPMAGNSFTLKFILVADKEKIKKLAQASQQAFVSQAKFVVVVCSNPSRPINEFGEEAKVWNKQQAGAAIENFLLSLTDRGLSTCWAGYFVKDQVKKLLKIPEDVEVEALFPIGFEYQKPKTRRVKIELDRVLYFDSYGNKQMKTLRQAY